MPGLSAQWGRGFADGAKRKSCTDSKSSSGGRQPGLSNQGTPWLEPSFPARPHGLAHRIRRDRRNHGPRGPQRHLGLAREARYSLTNRLAPGRLHFASDGAGSLLSHPVSAVNSEIASACYHGSEKKLHPCRKLSILLFSFTLTSPAAISSTFLKKRTTIPISPFSSAWKNIPTFASVFIIRSEEHTSELQSRGHLVCRLLLEKKNNIQNTHDRIQTLNIISF